MAEHKSEVSVKELEEQLVKQLMGKDGQMLIYAGAGVSMSAPSCSPSWWKLMNELLQVTFSHIPAPFNRGLTSDLTRQPEEIMETYYFLIKERLFSLFKLLEAGSPNANHVAMAKLAKAGKVKAILTTNFDIFIERALTAEHVAFKTVVTAEEFEEYLKHGCKEFAVLKIHGTIDRPATIVAVANHYKSGKGFSGAKADVMAFIMQHHPTLFLGYSGWDFMHANYQAFWKRVGAEKGQDVYWLTLKGASGGPDLDTLVGAHIGRRFHQAGGTLPDFAVEVLHHFDKDSAAAVTKFAASVDSSKALKEVEEKRAVFMKEWAAKELSKTTMFIFIMMESNRLNEAMQARLKKRKQFKEDLDVIPDVYTMSGTYADWAKEMGEGKITYEEYARRSFIAGLNTSVALMVISKNNKTLIKKCIIECTEKHKAVFDQEYGTWRGMFGSIVANFVDFRDEEDTPEVLVQRALECVQKYQAMPDTTVYEKALRDLERGLMTVVGGFRGPEREEIEGWKRDLAKRGADTAGGAALFDDKEKWSEVRQVLVTKVADAVYHTVNAQGVAQLIIDEMEHIDTVKHAEEYVDAALMLALSLTRQAAFRRNEMYKSKKVVAINQKYNGGDWEVKFSLDELHQAEAVVSDLTKPVVVHVNAIKAKAGAELAARCDEVLAAVQISTAYVWYEMLRYNQKTAAEDAKMQQGHYPSDCLPPFFVAYLQDVITRTQDKIHDERMAQTLFALMVLAGDAGSNLALIEKGVQGSMKLTGGKVTEITPYPIPEVFAVQLERSGQATEALKWYEKALDGIKTCVSRTKTDAIVFRACDLQSKHSMETALRWALTYSPKFTNSQEAVQVQAGRELLFTAAQEWAKKLGYADIVAAQNKLIRGH